MSRSCAAKGCEIARADALDREASASAFFGVEAVFVLIPPLFDPSDGFPEMRAILASLHFAIEKAQPGRVVCLSTVGAQVTRPNLLNQLGLMERQFTSLPVAFLRAAWFVENFAGHPRGPQRRRLPQLPATARSRHQERWSGVRTIELQGPGPVSANDVSRALASVLGHPIRTEIVPRDQWEITFRSAGMKNPSPRMQMLDGFNEGWIGFSGDAEQRKGTTTLEPVLAGLVDPARAN